MTFVFFRQAQNRQNYRGVFMGQEETEDPHEEDVVTKGHRRNGSTKC